MDPIQKEVNQSNPLVFFDVGIGNKTGRVVFELFNDVTSSVLQKPLFILPFAR